MVSVLGSASSFGASDDQEEISTIEAIAGWCDSMAGNTPLRHGLRLIASGLGANAIAVSRVRKDGSDQANTVIHDRRQRLEQGPKLDQSFAEVVLGQYVSKSKSGTLWYSSMMDGMVDPKLKAFQQRRNLRELVVVPLELADKHVDFLELHFADRLDPDQLGLLNMATGTLVKTWLRRANGLFSDAALAHRLATPKVGPSAALLDVSNPAKLSRCEYRVCLLLSNGLLSDAIQKELDISRSNLRSHLRNIYSKTECSSLAELTYKLLSSTAPRPAPVFRDLRSA